MQILQLFTGFHRGVLRNYTIAEYTIFPNQESKNTKTGPQRGPDVCKHTKGKR